MATRSTISVVLESGYVQSIYCHYDGYLDHNGAILASHYNTQESVEELVELGDCSVLKPTLADSIFYSRDHGESLKYDLYKTEEEYRRELYRHEYNYLFKDGVWYVSFDDNPTLSKLEF